MILYTLLLENHVNRVMDRPFSNDGPNVNMYLVRAFYEIDFRYARHFFEYLCIKINIKQSFLQCKQRSQGGGGIFRVIENWQSDRRNLQVSKA